MHLCQPYESAGTIRAEKLFYRRGSVFLIPQLRIIPPGIVNYLKRLGNISIELIFLSIVSSIVCAALLYTADMFWFLYLETPMGQKFVGSFKDQAVSITEFLSFEILQLSIDLTLSALIVCAGVSCVSRLLHISRHFYLSIGFFSRLVFWGGALTALVTFRVCEAYGFEDYGTAGLFAAIPTACLFMSCFKYSDKLVPEFGDLAKPAVEFIRQAWAFSVGIITAADYEERRFALDKIWNALKTGFHRRMH